MILSADAGPPLSNHASTRSRRPRSSSERRERRLLHRPRPRTSVSTVSGALGAPASCRLPAGTSATRCSWIANDGHTCTRRGTGSASEGKCGHTSERRRLAGRRPRRPGGRGEAPERRAVRRSHQRCRRCRPRRRRAETPRLSPDRGVRRNRRSSTVLRAPGRRSSPASSRATSAVESASLTQ